MGVAKGSYSAKQVDRAMKMSMNSGILLGIEQMARVLIGRGVDRKAVNSARKALKERTRQKDF